MLEVRGDTDLAQKAFDPKHGTEVWIQHLECDVAGMLDVAGEVDRRHAADADLALDGVPARKRRVEDRCGVGRLSQRDVYQRRFVRILDAKLGCEVDICHRWRGHLRMTTRHPEEVKAPMRDSSR